MCPSDPQSSNPPPDAPDPGPAATRRLLERAWNLVHRGQQDSDVQAAVMLLQEHLERQPEDSDAFCLLSESYLVLGMPDESLDAAMEAMRAGGEDDPEPPFRSGLALFELAAMDLPGEPAERERMEPALHFIEAVLEIPPPRNPELLAQALEMFLESCRRGSANGGPFFWAGLCLLSLGQHVEALEAFQNASDCEGSIEATADGWFLQGMALEELEQTKEAGEAYRIALAHHPEHRGAAIRLRWLRPEERDKFLAPAQVEGLVGRIETTLQERRLELESRDQRDASADRRFRELAASCTGTLASARHWAKDRGIDADLLESFLIYHGAACDCEVLLNLEARLGLSRETSEDRALDGEDPAPSPSP